MARPNFKIWKTVECGTGFKESKDILKLLEKKKFRIGASAGYRLGENRLAVATGKIELDLVLLDFKALGLKKGASYEQICARGKEFGLDLCPEEVGPQLRLQHTQQKKDEYIVLAMKPFTGFMDIGTHVFRLSLDEHGLWLSTHDATPANDLNHMYSFIFVLPRQK